MNIKEYKKYYSFFQGIVNGMESLDFFTSLRYSLLTADKDIRKKVERIVKKVGNGIPFYKALIEEGFDRNLALQINAYERSGQIKQGLENILKQIEKIIEIDRNLRKIDRDIYMIIGASIVMIGILIFFYLPQLVEKLLKTVATKEQLENDIFLSFLYNTFEDISLFKQIVMFLTFSVPLVVAFFILKVHRWFLRLIPAFRKMLKENDKSIVITVFQNSISGDTAIKIVADLFKEKYNIDKVYRKFTEINYKAFKFTTLFSEEEKGIIYNIGETGNTSLFSFLSKEVERRRSEYVDRINAFMNLVKVSMGLAIVLVLYGIMLMIVYKISGFVNTGAGS